MFGSNNPSQCPQADGSSPRTTAFDSAPDFCIDLEMSYTALMVTNFGSLEIDLFAKTAPITVNNFVFLARYHYFDGLTFHRIIPDFVLQGGDPIGNGTGGPGYRFRDELPSAGSYKLGSLAMANAGPNTNGSQFFVISGPSGISLPPLYSLFGQVTVGLDIVATLDSKGTRSGSTVEPCLIEKVVITES